MKIMPIQEAQKNNPQNNSVQQTGKTTPNLPKTKPISFKGFNEAFDAYEKRVGDGMLSDMQKISITGRIIEKIHIVDDDKYTAKRIAQTVLVIGAAATESAILGPILLVKNAIHRIF